VLANVTIALNPRTTTDKRKQALEKGPASLIASKSTASCHYFSLLYTSRHRGCDTSSFAPGNMARAEEGRKEEEGANPVTVELHAAGLTCCDRVGAVGDVRRWIRDRVASLGVVLLDGGLASELEEQGADLGSHLWSAAMLASPTQSRRIRDVHEAFYRAGADIAITASYQVLPGCARTTAAVWWRCMPAQLTPVAVD